MKRNIAIVAGGDSSEIVISLKSADGISPCYDSDVLFHFYSSLVFAYTRHLSISCCISEGISESKNISSPVVG